MALDQLCEKINKMAKGMIGHAATPAKITAVHAEINVVQRIERAHDLISDTRHFRESATGKPDVTGDVEAIFRHLDDQINLSREELTQQSLINPLTGKSIALKDTPEKLLTFPKEGWRAYATSKLSQFHFGAHDYV